MPSAKFNEVYAKTREIKSGPSNDDLLNVRAPFLPPPERSFRARVRRATKKKTRTEEMRREEKPEDEPS